MADKNLYQYLGEDLQLEQFQRLATTIQKSLGPSPHAHKIETQLTKIWHKQEVFGNINSDIKTEIKPLQSRIPPLLLPFPSSSLLLPFSVTPV